jgi:hypothetical protein
MRELTNNFNQIIQSRMKTDKEVNDDVKQMSDKERMDYMLSDGERWKGPEYLIEYNDTKLNRNATKSIIRKRAKAQLVGRQKWREPIGIKNSKWYIPKTSTYLVSQSDQTGLKVYEPTTGKKVFEQVLSQKIGDPYLVSMISEQLMSNKNNNKGGKKSKKNKKSTRNHKYKHNHNKTFKRGYEPP